MILDYMKLKQIPGNGLFIDTKGTEAANMVWIAGLSYPLVISWFMAYPIIAMVTDCPNSFPIEWCRTVVFVVLYTPLTTVLG